MSWTKAKGGFRPSTTVMPDLLTNASSEQADRTKAAEPKRGETNRLLSAFFQEIPPRKPTPRLTDVDAARGLAMILVVVGHVVSATMPEGNDWYAALRVAIYRFHMPLFMVLTGI